MELDGLPSKITPPLPWPWPFDLMSMSQAYVTQFWWN